MKKNFIFIITVLAITVSACGQKLKETQVPSQVKSSFQKLHPGVNAKWEKENGNYEASFKQGGKEMSEVINSTGTIMETETAMPVSELPKAAFDYMAQHYKNAKIKDAAKIVNGKGEIMYEAALKEKDILFDANGKFLQETKD